MFEYYAVLVFAVGSLSLLAFLIWRRTRSLTFPVGFALLYFGTLHGAWSILEDKTGGDSHKQYAYLEVKMFPVALDADYLMTLTLYTVFLLVVAVTVYLLARAPEPAPPVGDRRLRLHHGRLIALSAGAGVLSYLIIREQFVAAALYNISGYEATRGALGFPRFYTVYQELNRVALLPLSIGLATLASGKAGRYLVGPRSTRAAVGYLAVLTVLYAYCLLLGNKNELLSASLLGALFYLGNTPHPRWARLAVVGLAILVGVGLVDLVRGMPLAGLSGNLSMKDLSAALGAVTGSNEQFASHFSLYGILHYHVPLTYGSSILSLAASVVPRVLWPARPEDIYGYYAANVGAVEGQGYTIHHAAGWYLNFGAPGLVFGALLLGGLWATAHNYSVGQHSAGARFWRILAALAPAGFTATLFMLARAGPEGYKSLIVDGFLIPTVCIAASSSWTARYGRARDGEAVDPPYQGNATADGPLRSPVSR